MRMRKVRHLPERLEAAGAHLVGAPGELKGKWIDTLLPGAGGLYVEIGCGKGKFILESALAHPDTLFVGVEKVGDALIKGLEAAGALAADNVFFVLGDAQGLSDIFERGEVSRVFLNFSDPWPHWKHAVRRLTHRGFLELYKRLLAPGGTLELKTDNKELFRFSCKELAGSGWRLEDVTQALPAGQGNIETEYEARFRAQGVAICRAVACPLQSE